MTGKLKTTLFITALLAPLSIWMYMNHFTLPDKKEKREPFKPLLAKADIPMDHYVLDMDSSITISRPTGTKIRIQASTFCYKDGSPVNGKIELNVREFHQAADILRSGIPMDIDKDKGEYLKSAGMIELRAYSQGKELDIKKEKSIAIDLAGYRSSEGYQLYYLNNDAEWIVPDSFRQGKNNNKTEKLEQLARLPEKPMEEDSSLSDELVFDLYGNFDLAPQLGALANRQWKICKDYNNPDIKKGMRINWERISMDLVDKKNMIYEMAFSKKQEMQEGEGEIFQSMILYVTPVMDKGNKRKDKKLFQWQMQQYEAKMKKVEDEKKRAEAEADLVNCFKINKMGVYNIDRLFTCDELQITSVSFDFQDELDPKINKLKLFAIYPEENSVIEYNPRDWNKVGLSTNKKMRLIAYLPGERIAVVENDEIQKQIAIKNKAIRFKTQQYAAAEYLMQQNYDLAKR